MLNVSTLTITLHPHSHLQSSQSLLKDNARQSMSATLKYACWGERGLCCYDTYQAVSLPAKELGDWVGYSPNKPNVTPSEEITLADIIGAMCPLTQAHLSDCPLTV